MTFIRVTQTNGADIMINIDYVAEMECQDAEPLNATTS